MSPCWLKLFQYVQSLRELILFLHVTVLDTYLLLQGLFCCNKDNLVSYSVVAVPYQTGTMMERRRALTLPLTMDKDSLVCVAHSFAISSFHRTHVNECAVELLLILARYCSDACFVAAVINHTEQELFIMWNCLISQLCGCLHKDLFL